jgi:hypothetical protein
MSGIGVFYVAKWVQEIKDLDDDDSLFAGLCSSNPLDYTGSPTGANPSELTGDTYHRLDLHVLLESYNLLSNSELLLWTNLPPGVVVSHIAAFDAHVNGELVAAAHLEGGPYDLTDGGAFPVPPGQFILGLDVPVGP